MATYPLLTDQEADDARTESGRRWARSWRDRWELKHDGYWPRKREAPSVTVLQPGCEALAAARRQGIDPLLAVHDQLDLVCAKARVLVKR
jgi:hypothetical protein